MKKFLVLFILAAVLLAGNAFAEEILNIVCTDFPCYDFARQIAGDHARITMLIKPGVEAHSYEPSPADILSIGEADLFVYIGGESDAWADKILATFGADESPETLRMMEMVEQHADAEAHDHAHEAPVYDEHIWLSPENAMQMVDALAAKMSEICPEYSEDFSAASAQYNSEIAQIDSALEGIAERSVRRELVFADRFPFVYFTNAYGLEYHAAFESCTAETEPSPMTLMMLIEKVRSENIPAIYTIEMSTQNVARTIAEETGAEILTMHSMQTVTQEEFSSGESYVSIMWKNVEAVEKGLN